MTLPRPAIGLLAALTLAVPVSVVLVQQSAGAAGRTAAAAGLPDANMEAILLAAQWDPVKSGTGVTPGSGPGVLLVERALSARGLLAASYVDGHFGTATRSAYAAYQRSLGYSVRPPTACPGVRP